MLDESYYLTYDANVLEDMNDAKRAVFVGPLKPYVILTTRVFDRRKIVFHFYQDHFIKVVEKWPWLLLSDLGNSQDDNSVTYNSVVNAAYRRRYYNP